MTSFTEDMRARGMSPAAARSSSASFPAGARLGRVLHVSPSEPVVVVEAPPARRPRDDGDRDAPRPRVARSRSQRAATSRAAPSTSCCEDRYGIEIVGGPQTIEPTVTNEEESAALGVPLHSPAFLFERMTRSETGEIVEYVRSIYRGDRYRLVTELSARPTRSRVARHRPIALVRRRLETTIWSVPSHATPVGIGCRSRDTSRKWS